MNQNNLQSIWLKQHTRKHNHTHKLTRSLYFRFLFALETSSCFLATRAAKCQVPNGSTEHGVLVTFSKAARIGMIGGCAISRDPNTIACTQAKQTAVNRGSHRRRKTIDNRWLLFLSPATESETF